MTAEGSASCPFLTRNHKCYISIGRNADVLLERQRLKASAVKMASAIQMSPKVSICAGRNGS